LPFLTAQALRRPAFLTRTTASPARSTARNSPWHNAAVRRRAHVARSLLRHATGGGAPAAHRERCGVRHGAFCAFGAWTL